MVQSIALGWQDCGQCEMLGGTCCCWGIKQLFPRDAPILVFQYQIQIPVFFLASAFQVLIPGVSPRRTTRRKLFLIPTAGRSEKTPSDLQSCKVAWSGFQTNQKVWVALHDPIPRSHMILKFRGRFCSDLAVVQKKFWIKSLSNAQFRYQRK